MENEYIYAAHGISHGEKHNLITKLDCFTKKTENAIYIGKIIAKIPEFFYFFIPIIDNELLQRSEFRAHHPDQCVLSIEDQNDSLVLLKYPSFGGNMCLILDYLRSITNNRKIVLDLMNGYSHLMDALDLLLNDQICHFNLHQGNILFSLDIHLPLIKNFSCAMNMSNIKRDWKSNLYSIKNCYIPLEVHYIYLLGRVSEPSISDIKRLCEDYVSYNEVLQLCFSPTFLGSYVDKCMATIKIYQSRLFSFDNLILYWKTWDNFAISLLFLKILYFLNADETGGDFTKNPFINHFVSLLLKNIHPDPLRRITPNESKKTFTSFFTTTMQSDYYASMIHNLKNIDYLLFEDKLRFQKLKE